MKTQYIGSFRSAGKTCTTCGRFFRYGEYQRDHTHKDGLKSQCTDCRSESQRIRRAKRVLANV